MMHAVCVALYQHLSCEMHFAVRTVNIANMLSWKTKYRQQQKQQIGLSGWDKKKKTTKKTDYSKSLKCDIHLVSVQPELFFLKCFLHLLS